MSSEQQQEVKAIAETEAEMVHPNPVSIHVILS
jgi:hypothetical protein